MKHIIAPSLLAADFANLQRDCEMISQSEADWLHIDIMDGVFVPNISFGFPVLNAVKKHIEKPLDVHLMIVEPDKYIEDFAKAGAAIITVHYEACVHLHRTIQLIKAAGCRAGVALNPHTPVELLADILADLDLVLVMSVNPGFGGQKFITQSLYKIAKLKQLALQLNPNLIIEVDGGVSISNAESLLKAGANALVAGNAVFAAPDPIGMIADLKSLTSDSHQI